MRIVPSRSTSDSEAKRLVQEFFAKGGTVKKIPSVTDVERDSLFWLEGQPKDRNDKELASILGEDFDRKNTGFEIIRPFKFQ